MQAPPFPTIPLLQCWARVAASCRFTNASRVTAVFKKKFPASSPFCVISHKFSALQTCFPICAHTASGQTLPSPPSGHPHPSPLSGHLPPFLLAIKLSPLHLAVILHPFYWAFGVHRASISATRYQLNMSEVCSSKNASHCIYCTVLRYKLPGKMHLFSKLLN